MQIMVGFRSNVCLNRIDFYQDYYLDKRTFSLLKVSVLYQHILMHTYIPIVDHDSDLERPNWSLNCVLGSLNLYKLFKVEMRKIMVFDIKL